MRSLRVALASAAIAAAFASSSGAQPQRFADLHRMLPWELGNIPFPPTYAFAVAAGDVDGDGDVDLLVGYDGQGPVSTAPDGRQNRLLLNGGGGAFTDATANLPQILDSTRALALGDVDGDGDLDAFVGNGGYAYLQADGLLLNDGTGAFSSSPAPLPGAAASTSTIALGDVDADGDLDAMVARQVTSPTPSFLLLLNGGAGIFSDASSQLPPTPNSAYAVAVGDLDGDGDLDAFVGGLLDRPLLNDGTGVFSLGATAFSFATSFAAAIALGDVDGDGDLDAVSARDQGCSFVSCLGAQNRLYLNGGSANFTDHTGQLPAEQDRTTSVPLGDVDGDGDLDLLFGNVGNCYVGSGCGYGENRLLLNNGAGAFLEASSQLPELDDWTHAVALVDVDGDADLDAGLATRGDEGPPSRLLLNDGGGFFSDASGESPSSPFPTIAAAASLGDLDGDGDLDAFVARNWGYTYGYGPANGVYLNDGAGRLLAAPIQPSDSVGGLRLALGDVDGDGDLDAMKVSGVDSNNGFPRLYLNDGAAGFTVAAAPPLVPGVFMDLALGDLDGDGDLDALFGMGISSIYSNNTFRVYLNSGSGIFSFSGSASPLAPSLIARAVALGDVDGDGDLDAYLATGGPCTSYACAGQTDRLILNNGSAVFAYSNAALLPILNDPTFAVGLGDVDGDGDLDALAGNGGFPTSSPDRLYLNNGAGFFTNAPSQLPSDNDVTSAIALGDLDGDGDLDALVGAYPQNRCLLNDGSGGFAESASAFGPVRGSANGVALGDLDGDADLDSVLTDAGELRVLSNLTRELAWRALPRIGKPLPFDMHGPAWGAWFLVASPGTGSVPLPPLGVMRLDLATLMPQFGGLLDGQGRAAVTYQVPAIPALVGQSLYWQAVVVSPARLTNLETTTFTNL